MRLVFSPRLTATLVLVGSILATNAFSAAAAASNRPFVERVKPDDYYAAEKVFPEPYSSNYELVVLRATGGQPVSVTAIKKAPAGEDYTLTLHMASASAPDGWLKISEDLDANVAQQILRASELKLHRQVALSNFKRKLSKDDTDLWLHQKLSDGRIAAARITLESTLDNPAATAFVEDLLGGLQQLIGTEGKQRADVLQKIDRTATQIILAESP
jgi:hypothetical protein